MLSRRTITLHHPLDTSFENQGGYFKLILCRIKRRNSTCICCLVLRARFVYNYYHPKCTTMICAYQFSNSKISISSSTVCRSSWHTGRPNQEHGNDCFLVLQCLPRSIPRPTPPLTHWPLYGSLGGTYKKCQSVAADRSGSTNENHWNCDTRKA